MSMRIKLTLSLMVLVSIKTAGAQPLTELLSREPCATSPDNYAQYVERQLGTLRQEAAAAAKLGLRTRGC